jgi:hypothetical protein
MEQIQKWNADRAGFFRLLVSSRFVANTNHKTLAKSWVNWIYISGVGGRVPWV